MVRSERDESFLFGKSQEQSGGGMRQGGSRLRRGTLQDVSQRASEPSKSRNLTPFESYFFMPLGCERSLER